MASGEVFLLALFFLVAFFDTLFLVFFFDTFFLRRGLSGVGHVPMATERRRADLLLFVPFFAVIFRSIRLTNGLSQSLSRDRKADNPTYPPKMAYTTPGSACPANSPRAARDDPRQILQHEGSGTPRGHGRNPR